MIKGTTTIEGGRQLLAIGLTRGELANLQAAELASVVRVDGRTLGLGIDVAVFSGANDVVLEAAMKKLTKRERSSPSKGFPRHNKQRGAVEEDEDERQEV